MIHNENTIPSANRSLDEAIPNPEVFPGPKPVILDEVELFSVSDYIPPKTYETLVPNSIYIKPEKTEHFDPIKGIIVQGDPRPLVYSLDAKFPKFPENESPYKEDILDIEDILDLSWLNKIITQDKKIYEKMILDYPLQEIKNYKPSEQYSNDYNLYNPPFKPLGKTSLEYIKIQPAPTFREIAEQLVRRAEAGEKVAVDGDFTIAMVDVEGEDIAFIPASQYAECIANRQFPVATNKLKGHDMGHVGDWQFMCQIAPHLPDFLAELAAKTLGDQEMEKRFVAAFDKLGNALAFIQPKLININKSGYTAYTGKLLRKAFKELHTLEAEVMQGSSEAETVPPLTVDEKVSRDMAVLFANSHIKPHPYKNQG